VLAATGRVSVVPIAVTAVATAGLLVVLGLLRTRTGNGPDLLEE
jgi:hypothetical protein